MKVSSPITALSSRERCVNIVLIAVLLCNLLVSVIKIIVGTATGMPSVTADGYHSVTDGFSNIIGMIGIRMASKPKDSDHAYGHRRYERLFTLWIAGLLIYLGIKVLERSISGLLSPDFRIPSGTEFALIFSTLAFNIIVAVLEGAAGRRLASPLLISDAKHTLSDIYVTCGVLISIALIKYAGAPMWADSLVSLCIAVMIFRTAREIYNDAADELTDHIAVDPSVIEAIVLEDKDVIGIHKIRSRRSGDIIYADFHVQCDPNMLLRDAHAMNHRIASSLNKHLGVKINCVIHTEDDKGMSAAHKEQTAGI